MIRGLGHLVLAAVLGFGIALIPNDIKQGDSSHHTWVKQLHAAIDRHKRWPPGEPQDKSGIVVEILFSIDRLGHILSIDVSKSSGFEAFDQEAVAIVKRSDPLEPVPWYLQGDMTKVRVPIGFNHPRDDDRKDNVH